ncbi:hypothetical protein CAPTEDRAFT_176694 [Capitella teleta]|uniref:AD domain-containing protein n=1 Tax=Capitella teleta TaxID=283909 RepID=R7UVK0_CAPTE|nr:hypothetical protein CAPTEDRAFT_176694 [Capitella teleta]|eukprot:ELU10334.1 hypothetical protein CAPTEDRAFT_176694 [Capitella teleta]
MADGDCFNIGMILTCTTCRGQKINGEVVAFDYDARLLILKSPSSSGKPSLNDIQLVNLKCVTDITEDKKAPEKEIPPLSNLNLNKLTTRLRQATDDKLRQVNYKGIGVTPQAQKLFLVITKTINEVKWDGQDIVILDTVTIKPPYEVGNCSGKEGDNTLTHVRKIVDKFYRDQESRESPASTSSTNSSS